MSRIMSRVKVVPTGCWEFVGPRFPFGYGKTTLEGRTELTHRAIWLLRFGEIENGLQVLHECDNPPCVNPHHLFLGTQADNMADRNAKGRARPPRGEAHHRAKLTEAGVREIRAAVRAGATHASVAALHGVSQQTVTKIVHRRLWAAVDAGQS